MIEILKSFVYLSLCVCLQSQVYFDLNSKADFDASHLESYAQFNSTEHDNIDEEHYHTHKHSEDGEEHEHHHEHTVPNLGQFQFIIQSQVFKNTIIAFKVREGFYSKNYFSSEHPFEIFRPPIS